MKNRIITKRSLAGLFVICPTLARVKANRIGQNNPTDEACAEILGKASDLRKGRILQKTPGLA
jgi:hypothetical protein